MNNIYKLETTTIWDFPERGKWLTHKGDYRGNWSPHIPKNLILKYTSQNDFVLDTFVGSGTTLIECKALNRNGIGIDINSNAIKITKKRLQFKTTNNSIQKVYRANACKIDFIANKSIDFICTHPPYANIIQYSSNNPDDLSKYEVNIFLKKMEKVATEHYRVLKKDKYCTFMIGDIRKNGNIIPLGFNLLSIYLSKGFILKEIIIKKQNNCHSTDYWLKKSQQYNFYLLAHEYIFVLKKP